jgi:hypothetical protein
MALDDAAIIALVPGIVEVAKRAGLPVRFAGLAAVGCAIALVSLSDLATGISQLSQPAKWLLFGLVYGLAASGLYSQVSRIPPRNHS